MYNSQLMQTVESRAGFVVNRDEPPRGLPDEVAQVSAMQQIEGSAEPRVQTLISNLENFFLQNPQTVAVYRSTNGI